LGIGKGSWLSLTCGLNNPKNYNSLSTILTDAFHEELIPLKLDLPKSKLLRNKSDHLSILLDGEYSQSLNDTTNSILKSKGCQLYSL